jgi:hypothetical protein
MKAATRSQNMRAEKQAVLANMEQQYARHSRQQDDAAMDMDTDTIPRSTQQQAKTPQKQQSDNSSLNVIKRIKKARGTTCRTRLVSVADVSTGHGRNWFSTHAITGQ